MNIVEELRQKDKQGLLKSNLKNKSCFPQKKKYDISHNKIDKENDYRNYFDEIDDAIYVLDLDGKIKYMNKAAYERLDYKKEELMGKTISKIDAKEYQDKGLSALKSLQKKGNVNLETCHVTKNGHKIPVEIYAKVISDSQKRKILAVARDITERKNAIKRYKTLFSFSQDALMLLSPPNWKFSSGNQSTLNLFQINSEEELKRIGPWELSPKFQPDGSLSSDKAKKIIQKTMQKGSYYFEWTHKKMNGECFPASVLLTRFELEGEKFIQATVRDISIEKKYEKEIRENENRLSHIFENLPIGIIAIDAKTHEIIELNKKTSDLIGLPKEEIIGNICNGFICIGENENCPFNDLTKKIEKTESILFDKNKNRIKILKNILPVKFKNREVLLESFVEITEIDNARKQIEKQKKQTEDILNVAGDSIRIINKNFEVIKVNDTFAKLVHLPKKDVIGMKCWEMFGSDDFCGTDKCSMNYVLKNKKGFERQSLRKTPDGRKIHCISRVSPFTNDKGQIIGIIEDHRDITPIIDKEKKIGEKNTQLSNTSTRLKYLMKDMQKTLNEFNQIFNNRSNAMIVLDRHFRVLRMNDLFVKKFDINKSKILGKRYDEAFNFLHCKKDSLKNKTCFIEPRLKENKRVEFEENYSDKYYTIIGTTILDRNNKIQSYVISYNDITEMKKQNKKLKKLDELKSNFLNVTSHELRTPMSSIKGYVQMMLKNMLGTINDEQSKALNVILRNTNRLDNLIQDILDISRLESGSMKFIAEETNIKEMLTEIGETMSLAASKENISLQINASDDLPIILIDQYRIKQVIMNLINNSIKFSAENTTITVKGFVEDDKTIIQVIDQGRGIPKEKQENVFDTFYQVDGGMDRKFGGAGLGLAISRGIILTHGGNIWVESSGIPGDGTTFSFSIPNKSVKNLEEQFKKLDMFKLEAALKKENI